jgi:hypothetical protein
VGFQLQRREDGTVASSCEAFSGACYTTCWDTNRAIFGSARFDIERFARAACRGTMIRRDNRPRNANDQCLETSPPTHSHPMRDAKT